MSYYMQFVQALVFFGIFIKKCVVFSFTSSGTLEYDCMIKTREIFDFV